MILNIYSIYDDAANAYMSPFFMHNHGLATRAFTDQVNSENPNQISEHPEQFALFQIGEYDDTTGLITSLGSPKPMGRGNEYKNQNPEITELTALINEFKALIKAENTATKLKEVI